MLSNIADWAWTVVVFAIALELLYLLALMIAEKLR